DASASQAPPSTAVPALQPDVRHDLPLERPHLVVAPASSPSWAPDRARALPGARDGRSPERTAPSIAPYDIVAVSVPPNEPGRTAGGAAMRTSSGSLATSAPSSSRAYRALSTTVSR